MTAKVLLVDFENVQQLDLRRLDGTYEVVIFVGAAQKRIPIELVVDVPQPGARVEWKRVDASGKNALDFFIACQLGSIAERAVRPQCIVLSRDKGFDPLLRHLNKNGLKCRRIGNMIELGRRMEPQAPDANYKRVIDILGKQEKKSRPRKRETLTQHVSALFQKKLSESEVDRIIEELFANKLINEVNSKIVYDF